MGLYILVFFAFDAMFGPGKYRNSAGDTYAGLFWNGKLLGTKKTIAPDQDWAITGYGIRDFATGSHYEGELVNGLRHGKGVQT